MILLRTGASDPLMKEKRVTVRYYLRRFLPAGSRRFLPYALMSVAFVAAAIIAFSAASFAVRGIEQVVERDARDALASENLDWAQVSTDGLLLTLSGEAPSEAVRFRALSAVGGVVAAERVIDDMSVTPSTDIAAPRFSMEVLRNKLDVSMIGLVPASTDTEEIIAQIQAMDPEMSVVNMLETADHAEPHGWEQALEFGLKALSLIPSAKVSIAADQVEVAGLATSERERDDLRDRLMRDRPRGLITSIEISAPRPVITPFTLRFVVDDDGARFDACSADTSEARNAILRAARAMGAEGALECTIGLGTPSPRWQAGAVDVIEALGQLGAGSVTMADTDISLIVPHSVSSEEFDQVVGRLENQLPDVFSLQATRLPPDEGSVSSGEEEREFVASRSTEGVVHLRGRLGDERLRDAVRTLAQAEFGLPAVQMNARIDPDLPEGWPVRALLAVESLAHMEHGIVRVSPDRIVVRGVSGDTGSSDRVARKLVEALGRGAVFNLDITYDERFDPVAMQPTPARCERWIQEALEDQQITFEPGSASIVEGAVEVVDRIAEILIECGRLEMEVAGHTDGQGRMETNMRLSQQRADSVVSALSVRGALVADFEATGYGPEFPIADNSTAAGREANRRIEFSLIGESLVAAQEERGEEPEEERDPPDESELEIAVTQGAGDATRPQERPER